MDKNKNNIFYKPITEYENRYDTIGSITQYQYDDDGDDSPIERYVEDVIGLVNNNISNIDSAINVMPDDIKKIISKPFNIIKEVINEFENPRRISEFEIFYIKNETKEEEDNTGGFEFPTSVFRDDPDPVTIVTNKNSKIDIIQESYNNDLVSIIKDYTDNMINTVNKYVNNTLTLLSSNDVEAFFKIREKYKTGTNSISQGNKHLSDTIIKSQINRDMKARLYDKMFTNDKTINHLRACRIGYEKMIRYYTSSYKNSNDVNSVISDRILESVRAKQEVAYNQNLTNLYKYLNSSVILMDECITMVINEMQSKTILFKSEGDGVW